MVESLLIKSLQVTRRMGVDLSFIYYLLSAKQQLLCLRLLFLKCDLMGVSDSIYECATPLMLSCVDDIRRYTVYCVGACKPALLYMRPSMS